MKWKRFTQEDIEYLKREFPNQGTHVCAKHLGRSPGTIATKARKLRLFVTKEAHTRILETAFAKPDDWYDVNINQFRVVEKPEVAYFLGYFWADGHVRIAPGKNYPFALLIQNTDYLTIAPMLSKLGKWGTFTYPNPSSADHALMTKVYTGNKPLVLWLLDHDYGSKSYGAPTKILEHIPEHLRHYWWRGYMDGDGSWRVYASRGTAYHFCFCADYVSDYTEHVNVLESLSISYNIERVIKKSSRASKMVCSNLDGTYHWGKYIYQGYPEDGIGLPRKWESWVVARDRYELYQQLKAVEIEEHPDTVITPDLLYGIIKRHDGLITRHKLVEHFHTDWWKIRDRLRVLFKQGRVVPIDNANASRYVAV